MTPLHVRFGRGYTVGLILGVLLGAAAWIANEQGLGAVQEANDEARNVVATAFDAQSVGATLGQIEDRPTSLVLRSDLARHAAGLHASWQRLDSDTDPPDDIRMLFSGSGGLAAQVESFLGDLAVLLEPGTTGVVPVDGTQAPTAGRLEGVAFQIAERLEPAIRIYEARADRSVANGRLAARGLFVLAVASLFALVAVLLRPLKRQLELESTALEDANRAHKAEALRQELAAHLSDGLEASETENEAQLVVTRAFAKLIPDHKVEMLVTSPEGGELAAVAVHPEHGGPGCTVESPWSCPAVRRGRTMVYDDSRAINACPNLADRDGGACAARCVPISFMGQSMGVLHATHALGETVGREEAEMLSLLASQVSIRLGTLRSFAQVEMQASTDPLTGLPNRRATEDRLRRLLAGDQGGSVAMADLDRFKLLNDRHGHEAGDRALRMFTEAVRDALRDEDWIGRWGGEEFLLVLPGLSGDQAAGALDRVREVLDDACSRAETPAVTASFGVVDVAAAPGADDLVRLADDALLAAKAQGRDRVVLGPVLGSLDADPDADPDADAADETEDIAWS